MSEIEDASREAIDRGRDSRLNSAVAVLVALTATMMAICNIKDGNIVQGMSQAQAKDVDTWSYYQAKSTKQNLAEVARDGYRLRLETEPSLSAPARARLDEAERGAAAEVARYEAEKAAIKKDAESYAATYDRLNVHDDQFDLAEACFTIGIALFGVSALTRRRWLFAFALFVSGFGAFCGLAGFMGWGFHPGILTGALG